MAFLSLRTWLSSSAQHSEDPEAVKPSIDRGCGGIGEKKEKKKGAVWSMKPGVQKGETWLYLEPTAEGRAHQ